jgi:hypothetical protein
MSNVTLPTEGFFESMSNPDYSYTSTISNGVVSITMKIGEETHKFTTKDIYTTGRVVQEYYLKIKKA